MTKELDINKSEFDDFKWLKYNDALKLAYTIYQQGKQRITIDVLKTLYDSGLL